METDGSMDRGTIICPFLDHSSNGGGIKKELSLELWPYE